MDITPYVESLRNDLANAAQAAGPEARAAAERIALALDPAMRLALMDALTQAAAEISAELPVGCVDVRLRGRDPEFVVDVPAPAPTPSADRAEPSFAEDVDDDATVARITLRIPESVKVRAEDLATKSGQSLNSWIVSALRLATRERAVNVDIDLSSLPFLDDRRGPGAPGPRRMTGWA
jgi:hypothetical protein